MKTTTTTKKTPKFAAGCKVRVTHGGRNLGIGRYVGSHEAQNGAWHSINIAEPRKPADIRYYRAANLSRV